MSTKRSPLCKPDLLLSDIGMPDKDGFELLKRMRYRTRVLRAGFLAHIAKPVEPAELVAAVASVAGRAG